MNEDPSDLENTNNHRFDPELFKKGLRCDLEQYGMLKRCSDKKDITEWNEWSEKNKLKIDVMLEGANFSKKPGQEEWYFKEVDLNGGKYQDESGELVRQREVYLTGAEFFRANMEDAQLRDAHLEGAFFYHTNLKGAVFQGAQVDDHTEFWRCYINSKTNFRAVALDALMITANTKTLLEYNTRRLNWEQWYLGENARKPLRKIETPKENRRRIWRLRARLFLLSPIRWFWSVSDYGRSTGRIIAWFFGLAFIFALIYRLIPTCVSVERTPGNIRGFWHVLYFSVVTMTTLGFGDIAANPDSSLGQGLLMCQVILGYVLLGALVTRFAVLFTAGGPAGRFANERTTRQRLKKLWNKIKKKQ